MKFGVREICDVVFKAKSAVTIGRTHFEAGQPVLYIDSAKTSTIEGAATTVYATGGKGNTRLVTWEGEKTLTFTVEDALLSPIGFAILSGAGLFQSKAQADSSYDGKKQSERKAAGMQKVHVHMTSTAMYSDGKIDLTNALDSNEKIDANAPIFAVKAENDGSIEGTLIDNLAVNSDGTGLEKTNKTTVTTDSPVFVDFYVVKDGYDVAELQIDAENFAGYYYVEASTLFRQQINGKDMPAEITFPNVKIQSNFTFSMASSGDPSTFTFTMDAMPGYTYFDKTKKVLCVIQIINETSGDSKEVDTVMPHPAFHLDNEDEPVIPEGGNTEKDSVITPPKTTTPGGTSNPSTGS